MDFTEKFKSFLEESKSKILSPNSEQCEPSIGIILPTEVGSRRSDIAASDLEICQLETDPHADEDTLGEIQPEYFDDEFDPSLYELSKLPLKFDQVSIDRDRKLLLQQLTVVSKKVFKLILERQNNCAVQLEHIVSVQTDVFDSVSTCCSARRSLRRAREQFTNSSLGILAACRRKQQAVALLENLTIIDTLQRTGDRLDQLIAENDFSQAIKLLLECQNVAVNYKHFTSIKQLSTKLQDTLVMTEEQLDVALARICTSFDTNTYAKIQEAYRLLGKTQTAMDQLLMHIASAVHNKSWNLVHVHAAMAASCNPEDLSKRPYPELCQTVTVDLFLPCLIDLAKALWDIMLNYRKILDWHRTNDCSESCSSDSDAQKLESHLQKQYIEKKLESGLVRIWQDVQTKVRVLVQASNLSEFSIDSFICFLDIIHRLIRVGKEFSGSDSETLQESLQKQCLSYFQAYHSSRLDELKTHLENEGWALCPVKLNFNVGSLVEFSHLKVSKSPSKKSIAGESSYFKRYWEQKTPFDDCLKEQRNEEDFLTDSDHNPHSDSDDDLSEEQKMEIFNENEGSSGSTFSTLKDRKWVPPPAKQGLCLANTTLMVLRLFGRYCHLMKLLHPIAEHILLGIKQLFEYYSYSVHKFFSVDLPESEYYSMYEEQLIQYLKNIEKNVLLETRVVTETDDKGNKTFKEISTGIVRHPTMPLSIDLSRPDTNFGFSERVIAVESCLYLAQQITYLYPALSASLASPQMLDHLFSHQTFVVRSMRGPVFYGCLVGTLCLDQIIPIMGKVVWELREVKSQHSNYVDIMLRQFQNLKIKIDKIAGAIPLSPDLRRELWDLSLRAASKVFVEGFSLAKRCTNEGRALMQLDFRQFVLKMETMCNIRPLPYQDIVSTYIKAFYIPEGDLEEWVKSHPEYTASQLVALVNSVAYSNNKTRQKLSNLVNDLSNRIRR